MSSLFPGNIEYSLLITIFITLVSRIVGFYCNFTAETCETYLRTDVLVSAWNEVRCGSHAVKQQWAICQCCTVFFQVEHFCVNEWMSVWYYTDAVFVCWRNHTVLRCLSAVAIWNSCALCDILKIVRIGETHILCTNARMHTMCACVYMCNWLINIDYVIRTLRFSSEMHSVFFQLDV